MTTDTRLIAKGRGEPIQGLVQQGKAHIALAKQYAAALIESGWSDEDTSALEREVALLEAMAATAPAGDTTPESSDDEATAVVEAKSFVRRLRNALPRALRETKATGLSEDIFDAGGKLGREAPRISAYLDKIRPSVEQIDGDLRRYFGGKSAIEALELAKRGLEKVEASQRSAAANLSEEATKLYATKGRVLEMIEDLNRAGRIAFEGQGETVGKFNKDVLLRARRERSGRAGASGGGADRPSGAGASAS